MVLSSSTAAASPFPNCWSQALCLLDGQKCHSYRIRSVGFLSLASSLELSTRSTYRHLYGASGHDLVVIATRVKRLLSPLFGHYVASTEQIYCPWRRFHPRQICLTPIRDRHDLIASLPQKGQRSVRYPILAIAPSITPVELFETRARNCFLLRSTSALQKSLAMIGLSVESTFPCHLIKGLRRRLRTMIGSGMCFCSVQHLILMLSQAARSSQPGHQYVIAKTTTRAKMQEAVVEGTKLQRPLGLCWLVYLSVHSACYSGLQHEHSHQIYTPSFDFLAGWEPTTSSAGAAWQAEPGSGPCAQPHRIPMSGRNTQCRYFEECQLRLWLPLERLQSSTTSLERRT